MGRVDWDTARFKYMDDSRVSYAMLAKEYGVSKSTVQAHATKHQWTKLRAELNTRKADKLLEVFDTDHEALNETHLTYYRSVQAYTFRAMNALVQEIKIGRVKKYHAHAIASLGRTLDEAIKQERLLLGLPYEPTTTTAVISLEELNGFAGAQPVSDTEIASQEKQYQERQKRLRRTT